MTFALAFWILMLIWLVVGPGGYGPGWGGHLVTFLLFLLLGWKVFGAPLN